MMKVLTISFLLIVVIMSLFFVASKKEKWEKLTGSTFECGFSSYYFSRFSFSIHYLIVALIFLFFDLELCFVMPFFNEMGTNLNTIMYVGIFILILLIGLLMEWKSKKLEWTK